MDNNYRNRNARRVVVTGIGVISPNGHGKENFLKALLDGKSGITFQEKLSELKFHCQIGGVPSLTEEIKHSYFSEEELLAMNEPMVYASIASLDAALDANLFSFLSSPLASRREWERETKDFTYDDRGAYIGTGIGGMDTIAAKLIPKVNDLKVSRLGSTLVEQVMCSSVSAKIGGLLGLGNHVSTNSSACVTGTEAIINGYHHIKSGRANAMFVGGAEGTSPYIWAGFDGMKVLNGHHNDRPNLGSRPLSASAKGFIPSGGAGILYLEELQSALKRGASTIYGEIVGGALTSGGHRKGGTMTLPSSDGVVRAIKVALGENEIGPQSISAINGHLTSTSADPLEIENWKKALALTNDRSFPLINSTKSLIGHALGAAGGIECVATLLQLKHNFLHPSINCEDTHPKMESIEKSIIKSTRVFYGDIIAKSSFGFGDVNGVLLFKRFKGV